MPDSLIWRDDSTSQTDPDPMWTSGDPKKQLGQIREIVSRQTLIALGDILSASLIPFLKKTYLDGHRLYQAMTTTQSTLASAFNIVPTNEIKCLEHLQTVEGIYRNIVYGKYQLVILSSQKLFTTAGRGVLLLSSIARNDLWLCCWRGTLYTDMVSSSRWLSLPLIQISPDDTGLRHLLARQFTWNSRMKIATNRVFGFEQNEELYYSNGQLGGLRDNWRSITRHKRMFF